MDMLILILVLALVITWVIVFLITRIVVLRIRANKLDPPRNMEQDFIPHKDNSVHLPPRMARMPPPSSSRRSSGPSGSSYGGREYVNLNAPCTKTGKRVAVCPCSVCENLRSRA